MFEANEPEEGNYRPCCTCCP